MINLIPSQADQESQGEEVQCGGEEEEGEERC
jgi:hypothetical protein